MRDRAGSSTNLAVDLQPSSLSYRPTSGTAKIPLHSKLAQADEQTEISVSSNVAPVSFM